MEFLGKPFIAKEELDMVTPLSPLLFVLATDHLQLMINKAKNMGLLQLRIPTTTTTNDFPVIQCDDDTLIVVEGDTRQLFFLKSLLNNFSLSTGLKINFNKSMMIPINVSDERLDILIGTFGCSKESLPFTYLGLPLSIARPKSLGFPAHGE